MHADMFIERSAVMSDCGTYRLRLDRNFGRPGKVASIGMVNPSDGNAEIDDQTILKLYGFSERFGFGRFIIWNLFALQSKHVRDLRYALDPVGPDNDQYIEAALQEADTHVVAWGSLNKLPKELRGRWRDVTTIADRVGARLQCLDVCADGHPSHPLMLSYDRDLRDWIAPVDGGANV